MNSLVKNDNVQKRVNGNNILLKKAKNDNIQKRVIGNSILLKKAIKRPFDFIFTPTCLIRVGRISFENFSS